jgi:D-alanyl-D-alanine carboxypeptidase (penicillin-binding protein 5/6)
VPLGVEEPLFVTIPRGRYDALEARLELAGTLMAPLESGQSVGELIVELDGEAVARRPLKVQQAVDPAGFFGRTTDSIRLWFGGLFSG